MRGLREARQLEARQEFLRLAADAIRHLGKHRMFESAGFFDFIQPGTFVFDNDTLVAALEEMVVRYAAQQWQMPLRRYQHLHPDNELMEALDLVPELPEGPEGWVK